MAIEAKATSTKEIINQARNAEINNKPEQAAALYEQARKAYPANVYPYERLMVIYRKLKEYKEELRVINEGIKFFQTYHESKAKKFYEKDRKIKQLSDAFMKKVGLRDTKGNNLYYPEPIPGWRKRKETVEKKLGKK